MRRRGWRVTSNVVLTVVGLMFAGSIAFQGCSSTGPSTPSPPDAWSTEPVGNSDAGAAVPAGTSALLDGVYEIATAPVAGAPVRYVFTRDGAFSREFASGGDSSLPTQSGTYLVDASGRLQLFIEHVGDGSLAVAVQESVELHGIPSGSVTLVTNGAEATFNRTGAAPTKSQGGPSAE